VEASSYQPRESAVVAQRLSPRGIAAYCTASAGAGFYAAFNNAALPLLIPSSNVLLINLLSNTRSIEGTIIQPVIGAWSDRTWTRLGRRRPFMLVALPASCFFLALTPFTPGLGGAVVCIVMFSLLFNMANDPYTALEADIAPPAQRPLLNGMATTVGFFGQVGLGLFLGFGPYKNHMPPAVFVVVALTLLVTWLVTIAGVHERRDRVQREQQYSPLVYLHMLRVHRQAFRCLLAFFCYSAGLNTILVNLTSFATHVLRVSQGEAIQLFLLIVLITGVCTLPACALATRWGLKPVLAGGMVLMAVGACGALAVDSVAALLPFLAIASLGNAAINSLTWPLLMQVIPAARAGIFAGLKTAAESVSAFFSSFVAFTMIGIWGYRSIFLVMLVGILASLAALRSVRVAEAEREIALGLAVA
jgi:maltose/moltooligosaccharide transporter